MRIDLQLQVLSIVALCNSRNIRNGSSKKGLCVSKKNFDCQDLALFPNISWSIYLSIFIGMIVILLSDSIFLHSFHLATFGVKTFIFVDRYYNWGSEYHSQSCNDPSPPPGYIPMVNFLIMMTATKIIIKMQVCGYWKQSNNFAQR